MGKIREGRWDCSRCGKKGNLGRDKICPGCGDPRGENVKFYLPENEPEVTDSDQLKKAQLGPDWNCEFCGSANQADRNNCSQCGAAKGTSPSNQVKDYVPPAKPAASNSTNADYDRPLGRKNIPPRRLETPNYRQEHQVSSFPKKKALTYGGIGLGVILLGLFAFLMLHTKDVPVQLTGVTWTREIQIEKYKTVEEEDWSVPTGGREKSSTQKVHHYDHNLDHVDHKTRQERVQVGSHSEEYTCGTTDKGNGYFEDKTCTRSVPDYGYQDVPYDENVYRDDPVYKTWYTYDIERWKYERSVHAGGTDQKVYWPQFTLADPKITQIGKERRGSSKENYEASFRGGPKNKDYNMTFNYQRWSSLKIGATYIGKMNVMGMLLKIEDPK
ncbi:MAG: zinc finger Ran-binding domain-containing protein [Candidatus Parcubacteria bacterium]|nr:zinc finger Ran-binding domain-containing protein [Candidatus Parcubacteria bacterium]